MKLVNIFAAVGIISLVAAGCSTTSSSSGSGGAAGATNTGGTGTGGTGNGGTSNGGTGNGGTSNGGTSNGGTGNGGTGNGGTAGSGGAAGGGSCTPGQTYTCDKILFDQSADGGPGACSQCMQSKCCNEVNACFGDAACSGLNDCLMANCQNNQTQACATQYCSACLTQTVVGEITGIQTCQKTNCATECGGTTDGGI